VWSWTLTASGGKPTQRIAFDQEGNVVIEWIVDRMESYQVYATCVKLEVLIRQRASEKGEARPDEKR
jgi:hypothetical protein